MKKNLLEERKLGIPINHGIILLCKKDIIYCQSDENYSVIYLNDNKKCLTTFSLNKIEEVLSDINFFRCHKSSLVNIDYIWMVDYSVGFRLVLKDGTKLPLSRRKKKRLIQVLNELNIFNA